MPEGPSEPKYRVIADGLREAIQRGDYPPGSRLPGENDIIRDQDVARMTARQALAQLINEGVAVARKGSGVYVRDGRPVVRDRIARLGDTRAQRRSIWSSDIDDRELEVDQIYVGREEPPDRVRVILELGDNVNEVVVRRRRFVRDGKPVLQSVSYVPIDIASGSRIEEEDTGPGGTYARLAERGYAPVHFRDDLRSRMPEQGEADRLQVSPGTPLVEIARTAYASSGRVVEVSEMIADASAHIFRYDFDGPEMS